MAGMHSAGRVSGNFMVMGPRDGQGDEPNPLRRGVIYCRGCEQRIDVHERTNTDLTRQWTSSNRWHAVGDGPAQPGSRPVPNIRECFQHLRGFDIQISAVLDAKVWEAVRKSLQELADRPKQPAFPGFKAELPDCCVTGECKVPLPECLNCGMLLFTGRLACWQCIRAALAGAAIWGTLYTLAGLLW